MGYVSLTEDILERLFEDLTARLDEREIDEDVIRFAKRVPLRNSEVTRVSDSELQKLSARDLFCQVMAWSLQKAKLLEQENDRLRRDLQSIRAERDKAKQQPGQLRADNKALRNKLQKIRQIADGVP